MTRKKIVQSISEDLGFTHVKAKEIVEKVFDAILETLVKEERVELRNFGIFQVKRRGPRKARNPKTGGKVLVPEKFVVTFKPGHVMQQRVEALGNGSQRAAEAADPARVTEPSIGVKGEEHAD
jgi:nucleoid DNA-binding protein